MNVDYNKDTVDVTVMHDGEEVEITLPKLTPSGIDQNSPKRIYYDETPEKYAVEYVDDGMIVAVYRTEDGQSGDWKILEDVPDYEDEDVIREEYDGLTLLGTF